MNAVTKKEINKTMIEEAVRNILVALGENPDREGLMETPKRVAKAYAEIFDGINYTNEELATMYDKGFTDSDLEQTHTGFGDFVLIKNINAYSVCEHHMLPMLLDVHVAYIPKDKVMGLSKIPRIVKHVTKRLQLQERIGKDIYDDYTMANLLEDVAKMGIARIRFTTSHPWDFTDEMIDVIAKYPNIMPSVHLPVQSGSSHILKLMGRRYTRESYLELFHKIKDRVPGVSISTDIIVGFPGETEEDFQETLSLVRECQYDNAFTFVFSKREGTPACRLADPVLQEEKEERLQRLNEVVNHYFLENNKKLVGSEVEVLVEGISDKKHMYYGYSDTNKLINFSSKKELAPGDLVMVKIIEAKTWSLDGEAVE